MQVLGGLFAQEMVDPVHLLLVEYRVDDSVQRLEALLRGAEWLLVHSAGFLGQPVLSERLVSSLKATGGTAR